MGKPGSTTRRPAREGEGRVRVIGGQLRGSYLYFPARPGLRPTGDRLRETIFNWLQPSLPGARCLDLFAGSGVMGIEAVSRGAAHAMLVENDSLAAAAISNNLQRLAAGLSKRDAVAFACADVPEWLAGNNAAFDLVFVDPPYAAGMHKLVLQQLVERKVLSPAGQILVEWGSAHGPPLSVLLDNGWEIHRQSQTRHASCALLRKGVACAATEES